MSAYMPDMQIMAIIIAKQCIDRVRKWPYSLPEWYEGRANAAATIYPCIETLSAINEIKFLHGDYVKRHGRFL